MKRRLGAEFLGSLILVAAVVGSGIMATTLTDNLGIDLLINAVATCAALGVLIFILSPVSGAHFNPAVTVVAAAQKQLRPVEASGYIASQIAGAICGATLANVMFSLPAWTASATHRTGPGIWIGEVVATAGLLFIIGVSARTNRLGSVAITVPLWIGAAYFFTASTSFANPAVTIGRMFSDTFTGISPGSVPAFVAFQFLGAAVGAAAAVWLFPKKPAQQPQPTGVHP